MKEYTTIRAAISELLNQLYKSPASFESFGTQLQELGIVRFTFDAIKNEMRFYSEDEFVHSIVRSDLIEDQKIKAWYLGATLHLRNLENAIHDLDSGRLSAVEFHREIFSAGVVLCVVYLTERKNYYLGKDGEYYLERF